MNIVILSHNVIIQKFHTVYTVYNYNLFNPIHIELLSVFLRLHTQMKRVCIIACFDYSTSFFEAITVYTIKTWALGGVWGLGEGNYHMKNMKNF